MSRQLFYLKHPFDFDVDRLLSLFFQRPALQNLPTMLVSDWSSLLGEILSYLKSPLGQTRKPAEQFIIDTMIDHRTVIMTITNCGFPVQLSDFRKRFTKYSNVSVEDNSEDRLGQVITIIFEMPKEIVMFERPHGKANDLNQLFVRELAVGEEYQVSKLFYNVYRYRYINKKVYDPELIAQEIKEKRLISFIGVTDSGEIVSHVGLVLCNEDPIVYEAAWGVVDPAYANRGIFRTTFEAALERMQKLPMSYSVYDFVTNHDFSQRLVSQYGYHDMAIFVGNQVSETQARMSEISHIPDRPGMERYSLLLGIDIRNGLPFGSRVTLPINIGETCDFLLSNMGISWEPTNRFESLPVGGHYTVKIQHEQKSILFDLYDVGRSAVDRILTDLSHQLRVGLEYAAVEFPLNVPGVGYIHDALADAGFFMAGLIPYRFTNQLGFRMQFLTPTDLDFDAIKIHSPTGQRLLQIVKEEWERNHLI